MLFSIRDAEVPTLELPTPLRDLLFKDLLNRLHDKLEPCHHLSATLLISDFCFMANQWQAQWPDMPMAVYRGFFQALRAPELGGRDLIPSDPENKAVGVAVVGLVVAWKLNSRHRLAESEKHLAPLVVELLSEIFEDFS